MQLYKHQIEALNTSENQNKVAYYHDMGLGKTFTGAEKMIRLGARINLLICQKSKIQDWFNHFNENYSDLGYSFAVLINKNELGYFVEMATNQAATLKVVGIINYELAWRRPELLNLEDFTLILDESSLIQNRTAKQSRFILKLQPKNVILLSGTPTAGKYENLWTQARLLGWEISERLYNQQYVNWTQLKVAGGITIKVVDKANPYKNIERLKQKLREHGAQFLKTEDVLTLPEQTFVEINVSRSKEYARFMKNFIVSVDGVDLVGDTNLTKRLYARQLCGIYSKEKLQAFRDLVQSTNDRIIVFYNFTEELKQLTRTCEELNRPTNVINGSLKEHENYENCSDSVTLVQYQAGAMGLNLQKANKVIYYTLPERCELFMQSQKRVHRIGQEKPCFYYILQCKNTVDEQIYKALKRGVDFTDELFIERN